MTDRRSLGWALGAAAAVFWISLVGVIQPAGVVEVAAMVAIALIAAACAALAVIGQSASAGRAVPVRARRRPQPVSRVFRADAPGRPQPRAPGSGRSCS